MARILVADDEKDVLALIQALLEENTYVVQTASDGSQALAALGLDPQDPSISPPDLAILDVMMPIVDGFTVSEKMFACERTRNVPVLVATAHGEMIPLFRDSQNVIGYLHKPFEARELMDRVEAALRRKT